MGPSKFKTLVADDKWGLKCTLDTYFLVYWSNKSLEWQLESRAISLSVLICVAFDCSHVFDSAADLFIWRSTNVDFHLFRLLLKNKCRFTKENPWFSKSTQHFCILRVISRYACFLTFCSKIVSKASIVTLFDREIFSACNLSQCVQFVIVL